MYGTYKLYEKDVDKEELDEMSEEDLLSYFSDYIDINTRARQRGNNCIECESESWYTWKTRNTLDATYWLCIDCYQVRVKAATG